VEDDPTLQLGLAQVLAHSGHQAMSAGDGAQADVLLATEAFDLLVLDLGLPKMDGMRVLERLRQRKKAMPVLILSARDRPQDRVQGLDCGADDYLSKPFDLAEFEARVRALLRRGQGQSASLGRLEWFWDRREATIDGRPMDLSRHEATVLEALMRTGRRVTRKDALAASLGEDGVAAGDNTVEVYISRLRRKLALADVEIRTVRGLGYRLQEAREDTS
jgi:DNA-binding response OmpR family regulator